MKIAQFIILSVALIQLIGCFPNSDSDRNNATPDKEKKLDNEKDSSFQTGTGQVENLPPISQNQLPEGQPPVRQTGAQIPKPECDFKSLKTADFGKGYTECWTRVKDGEVAEKYPDGTSVCIEKNNIQNVAGSFAGFGAYKMFRDVNRDCWIEEKHIQK